MIDGTGNHLERIRAPFEEIGKKAVVLTPENSTVDQGAIDRGRQIRGRLDPHRIHHGVVFQQARLNDVIGVDGAVDSQIQFLQIVAGSMKQTSITELHVRVTLVVYWQLGDVLGAHRHNQRLPCCDKAGDSVHIFGKFIAGQVCDLHIELEARAREHEYARIGIDGGSICQLRHQDNFRASVEVGISKPFARIGDCTDKAMIRAKLARRQCVIHTVQRTIPVSTHKIILCGPNTTR